MATLKKKNMYIEINCITFVQEHSDAVNDPLYVNDALVSRSNKCWVKKSVNSLPIVTQGADISRSTIIRVCHQIVKSHIVSSAICEARAIHSMLDIKLEACQ